MNQLRLGIEAPSFGPDTGPEAISAVAETAERLGFHSISISDRLLLPLTSDWQSIYGLPDFHVYDVLETLTFIAARTERIDLSTGIVNSLFQPPVILARRLATIDHLSNGRLTVGIGLGWMPEEYAVAGVPMTQRGARFEDHLAAMRACWAPDPVEYAGEFYQIPKSKIGPKPLNGTIPVLIGGLARPAVERAARIGDGFVAAIRDWETTLTEIAWYREAGGTGPVVVRVIPTWPNLPGESTSFAETLHEELDRFANAGVDEVHWGLTAAGFDITRQLELLHAIAEVAKVRQPIS
jgi:probable F420-dependent oxidoreductase